MGGNLNQNEPSGCDNWKSERKVWRRLHRHGFIDYMEKLHGSKKSVSQGFVEGCNNNKVTLFQETWKLDEDLVVEVIGLQKEGTKFYRDQKFAVEAIKNFPKSDEEKVQLTKKENVSYYLPHQVKSFWQNMLRVLMEFLIVDGRFTKVYNYHFAILNHFCHGFKISLPFYLASSLNEILADHEKKPKSYPIAHQGLILLIYEHLKKKARVNKEDPLVENAHISDGHDGSEYDDDSSNIPLHKKGRVGDVDKEDMDVDASSEEERGKATDDEVESEKKEVAREEEEVQTKVYVEEPDSNPIVSDRRNVAQHTTKEVNPNFVISAQGMETTDSILKAAKNSTVEFFNFQKWVIENITSILNK